MQSKLKLSGRGRGSKLKLLSVSVMLMLISFTRGTGTQKYDPGPHIKHSSWAVVSVRFGEPQPLLSLATLEQEIDLAVQNMARISGFPESLIYGIMKVENPMRDPNIVNWYGAVGLMQVVPRLHLGEFPECGDDLKDVFTNICYGVSILEYKLQVAGGDMERALLYYNGCWGSTYKPGCEVYPERVMEGL